MPTDWTKPGTGSSKTNFPSEIIALATDAAKMTHSGSLNLPSGAIAYNRTTDQLEEWNGSTWSTAPVGVPVGAIMQWLSGTAPSGYLLLQGGTIGNAASAGSLRANADCSALFDYLWTNLANAEAPVSSGRGGSSAADFAANKTITVPDMRQRFPIGKAASGTGVTLGGTGGNIDHTHSNPAHYHGMGTGATLNITSSGGTTTGNESANHGHSVTGTTGSESLSHTHQIPNVTAANNAWTITGAGSAGYIIAGVNNSAITSNGHTHDFSITSGNQNANHTHTVPAHIHPAGNIAGTIGLVTGGVDGNAAMTSGTGNPPFLAMNFIIKF